MAKDIKYKNSDSLGIVRDILGEADRTLNDKGRTTQNVGGDIGKIMDHILKSEAFGIGAAATGLAAAGGLIGGGMVAGIGVLAAPAVVLGGGAYYAASKIKQKKLVQEKEALIQRVALAHDRIMLRLESELGASEERLNHLKATVQLLMMARNDLESDLNAR